MYIHNNGIDYICTCTSLTMLYCASNVTHVNAHANLRNIALKSQGPFKWPSIFGTEVRADYVIMKRFSATESHVSGL